MTDEPTHWTAPVNCGICLDYLGEAQLDADAVRLVRAHWIAKPACKTAYETMRGA